MLFAKINRDGTDTGQRAHNVTPVARGGLHPSKPFWVPVVEEIADTSTGSDRVVGPWIETVEAGRVLRSRSIRDRTPAELAADDKARIAELLARPGAMRAVTRALHAVINSVRELDSLPALSNADFELYLESLAR